MASWDSLSGGQKSHLECKQASLPEAELGKPGFNEGVISPID